MDIPKELRDVFCFPGAMPFIVISNDNGRTVMEEVSAENFFIRCAEGLYKERPFLSYVPASDERGRWIGTPANAVLVLNAIIKLRGKDLARLN